MSFEFKEHADVELFGLNYNGKRINLNDVHMADYASEYTEGYLDDPRYEVMGASYGLGALLRFEDGTLRAFLTPPGHCASKRWARIIGET